ncbi:MAG: hypothetical protein BGO01_20455 [Armatimonadetes bacterium 55-13]|nr:MAG: hypothetical protein BGO01_20455 [Armatimonadetes bacterium 55-13]
MRALTMIVSLVLVTIGRAQVSENQVDKTPTPISSRLAVVGSQLGQVVTTKLWGTTLNYEAAMPANQAEADQIVGEIFARGYNLLRLHHVDPLIKTRGYAPMKYMLSAGQKFGVYIIVSLASADASPFGDFQYLQRKALEGGSDKDAVSARAEIDRRIKAFAAAVGDSPALLAVEPLNEESGDPATYADFVTHIKSVMSDAKLSAFPLFKNAGVSGDWSKITPTFPIVSSHLYGDDAREGDPLTKYYATLWAEQPWQTADIWAYGAGQPRGILEVGSLWPNPLRFENELWLAAKAKAEGLSAICWFLSASNKGMLAEGPFVERYTEKEPMRAAARHLGRYVFLDPSPVKTFTSGRETTYETDLVRFKTSGDPWGERKLSCIVSADGLPIPSSKHLFISGGGTAQPTGFISVPTQDDGKYLSIAATGTLPWIVAGGGPVRFANQNSNLKAFYFDPITMKQTAPALIQKVSPTDWVVFPSVGLEIEVTVQT